MELTALYQRVIGLDVHQAKITACAIVEHNLAPSCDSAPSLWACSGR